MKLRRDAPGGVLPRKFYLPADGGSENKNKWMISYLSLLVEVGMFDYIKMSYHWATRPGGDSLKFIF